MASLRRPTRDVVLRSLSHELNTAVTTVVGNIRVLRSDTRNLDEEARRLAFRDLEEHAHRLQFAIQNVLTLERLNVGDRPYLEPIVLPILMKEVVPVDCHRGGRHIIINKASDIDFPVALDRNLFRVLLINLIENACLYSPSGAPVDVITHQRADFITVAVVDQGPGIEPDDLPLIFDPYYRSPKVAPVTPGLGIGLTVAKRIAELHQAELSGANRREGGAIFELSLPALKA